MTLHPIETAYPLTPLQRAMVLASIRDPEGSPYQAQCQVEIEGPLEASLLQEAWRRLIRRHPALRSFFAWEGREEPLQVIRADADLPWRYRDWAGADRQEQERRWSELLERDAAAAFDLAQAPIMRLTLVRLNDERHRLLWSLHHALADGWSGFLVFHEMVTEYEGLRKRAPLDRPSPPPYGLFLSWLAERDREAGRAYWTERLRGLRDATPLPGAARSGPGPDRDTVERRLEPELSESLSRAAIRMRVTPYTLILAAWSLVLDRFAPGHSSLTFGTTVSERPAEIPGIEGSVGMFLNTVPLRIPAPGTGPLQEWLRTLQRTATDARHHGVGGLGEIARWAELEPGGTLARSLVVYESFPESVRSLPPDSTLRLQDIRIRAPSDLPLTLLAYPGDSLLLQLDYDTARYTADSARRLLSCVTQALEEIGRNDPTPVETLDVLPPAERHTLLEEWNRSPVPEPEAPDVLEAFDDAVARTPDAVAVRDGEVTLSYRMLDEEANRLAHRILEPGRFAEGSPADGLPGEVLLGVPAEPRAESVVAILACLKAGVGYVPFDPHQPQARLAQILGAVQGVLGPSGEERWGGRLVPTTDLDTGPVSAPPVSRDPGRIAYVIFTSGSTGRPKGVVVERGHLARSTAARLAWYERPPGRFLLLSSLAVDSSVAGVYWTLCTGGCLVLAPARAEQDATALARRIEAESVTTTLLVPSLWATLLQELEPERLGSLECVVVAGEACPPSLVTRHHRALPGVRLVNEYGPSEATVWATAGELVPEPRDTAEAGPAGQDLVPRVTVGRPVPFVRLYLLDEDDRPVPIGAPGEICLGGDTVARGYLEAESRDRRRFGADPFRRGGRMYRTGDRGRFREDGRLEFLGRVDDQLKIRGYRVEPGEIEGLLDEAPGVVEAAVILNAPPPAADVDTLVAALLERGGPDADALLTRLLDES